MKKKSIYISYTGGTIGMLKTKKGYVPEPGNLQNNIIYMQEFLKPEIPKFKIKEYNPLIDSSNMTPQEWIIIANDIKKNYNKYDGFIVLHGTDTMSYTASALSFILEDLNKPVIITGSQLPISEIRSDGRNNLLNSLIIAAKYPINEVTIFFNNWLYRGNRTTKINANGFHAFDSPNFPPLLEAGVKIREIYNNKKKSKKNKKKQIKVNNIYPQPIAIISIYPGISYKIIKNFLLKPIKALILCSYGIGNAPQDKYFLNSLKNAIKNQIIILNLTQCISGKVNMNRYASGNSLADIGVISGHDLTIEAALTKLHFLFSQNFSIELIKKKIEINISGEITTS
ncbi:asparaginase [Buchnera aphidicola (Neophyllaphis varicolor)]|uniref:asparaginase n=1 Tax=Buchnera aphidicola TaxID=9 RepID=UPI0031B80E18